MTAEAPVHPKFKAFLATYGHSQKWLAEGANISTFDLNRHINKGQHLTPEQERSLFDFLRSQHPGFTPGDIYG